MSRRHSLVVYGWAAAALLAASLLLWGLIGSQAVQAETAEGDDLGIGVVDFSDLLTLHPDYRRLQQLDEQIALLEQEKLYLPLAEQRERGKHATERFRSELEQARHELEQERARLDARLKALLGRMQAQLEAESRALSAHYEQMARREIQKEAPDQVPLEEDQAHRMAEFLQDLQLIRERNLAARRLELEKASQQRLEAERRRVEAELAAYEDELLRRNQQRKLNLQLQMSTATSPEEEARLQEELSALSDQEQALKEEKRAELYSQLDARAQAERRRVEAELAAYREKLDAEVQQKAAAERMRLAGKAPAQGSLQGQVREKIRRIEERLGRELAAKKREMEARFQADVREATRRLEAKRAEIEARLAQIEKELKAEMESSLEDLSGETRKRLEEVDVQLKTLQEQRRELHDRMVADLAEQIGATARKHGVRVVLGEYIYNRSCTDLTDLSMVAIRQSLQ